MKGKCVDAWMRKSDDALNTINVVRNKRDRQGEEFLNYLKNE